MKERELKDYIVKLNDRNIQRQRETGFTLYAILGALIFCFFYLIDNLQTLIFFKTNNEYLCISVFTANALFILFYFYLSYETLTRKRSVTKIIPNKEPIDITIVDAPLFAAFATICFLNFYFLPNTEGKLHFWFCILFGILAGLNLLSPFLMVIWRLIKRRNKKKKGLTVEVVDFTVGNVRMIKLASAWLLFYGALLFAFAIVTILKIDFTIDAKSISEVVKYTCIFFGLLFLIKTATDIKAKEKDNNQLEDFEKEIFFDDIANKEIAQRFETEFASIPFSKWMTTKYSEVKDYFDTKRQEFLSCDLLMVNLDNIDKAALPFEHNGRLNKIISEQIQLLNETNDFVQKIATTFNNLKNYASLNEQEAQDLFYVQNYLNNNIRGFNSLYKKLSKQITERQKL
jgi:hypothetical protein